MNSLHRKNFSQTPHPSRPDVYVNSDRIRTVYADLESVKLIISFLRNAGQ